MKESKKASQKLHLHMWILPEIEIWKRGHLMEIISKVITTTVY
jgi:hypothetical protein